ncbi:hypothetical protein D039_4766A, partial [Vibrio parahaemolyticus EKP-028]
MPLSA